MMALAGGARAESIETNGCGRPPEIRPRTPKNDPRAIMLGAWTFARHCVIRASSFTSTPPRLDPQLFRRRILHDV